MKRSKVQCIQNGISRNLGAERPWTKEVASKNRYIWNTWNTFQTDVGLQNAKVYVHV